CFGPISSHRLEKKHSLVDFISCSAQMEIANHPEDILPMVLTSVTQELFDCRADEDVTAESPYKLLQTEDIIQDIKTRAGVSDFSPVKQIVLDYPDDEILLVYDRAFTYGQLFYLVLTPEAKDRILNPPEPEETQGESEWEVCRTPESKEWISLGSELEIEEESVKETREKLLYKFSRVRRELGKPVSFSDRNTADAKDGNLGFASYEDSRFSIKLMQRDCGTQAVSRLQSSSVQTQWYASKSVHMIWICSTREGEMFLPTSAHLVKLHLFQCNEKIWVLQALQQEEIMNVFRDDWMALGNGPEAGDWSGKDSKGLMLHQAFTDHKYTKDRKISSINWHPTIDGKVANLEKWKCSHSKITSTPSFIVFFCFSDPSHPQLLLESPGDILAFKICPSDPNIIVGGCMNGQVVLWDISAHVTYLQRPPPSGKKDSLELDDNAENVIPTVRPCAMSTLENSHKGRITDVKWLPATFEVTRTGEPVENKQKMSVQVVTCSPDRTIMFWDVRAPKTVSQSASDSSTVDQTEMTPYTVLDTFKHLGRTWRPLLRVLRVGNDILNEKSPISSCVSLSPLSKFPSPSTVSGPITVWSIPSSDRPSSKDIILTAGGFNFAIWKEGVIEGPIILSPNTEQVCTVGCWSLSRPAVFFIGKDDGSIEVWNLLEQSSEPVEAYLHVTNAKITCITPWISSPKQHFLAVTDELGMVRILEIPKKFFVPGRTEVRPRKFFFCRFTAAIFKLLRV
uniref:Dynein axonemal intermediate chain 3 n=1 Tax=Scophthalmus maximus TaxID=52904 RepID=A0A8D3BUF2_SCOMX